ncbi:hypothetical protein Lal_00042718 [Lupinus albus]|nr:hypothetical protein Lal_00042718 [Lupinus albus]
MESGGSSYAVGGRTSTRWDPYYSPSLQATRLAKFQRRKLAYVCYVDVSWLVEQGLMFPHHLELHDTNTFVELLGELTNVGSLTIEIRLLHYVIAYILVQHNTNHAQPMVMFGIASSSSQLLSYGIFISRIIDHMDIDTSDVEFQLTNTHEWTTVNLDLSDEEHLADIPEQHPDPTQVEASQASQAPPFGVAADIQREAEQTKNDIDRISFIMQTMSSFSHPPPLTDKSS